MYWRIITKTETFEKIGLKQQFLNGKVTFLDLSPNFFVTDYIRYAWKASTGDYFFGICSIAKCRSRLLYTLKI